MPKYFLFFGHVLGGISQGQSLTLCLFLLMQIPVPQDSTAVVSDLVYRGEYLHRLLDLLCWELTAVLCVDFDVHPRYNH